SEGIPYCDLFAPPKTSRETGIQRNLIPPSFVVPWTGVPLLDHEAESRAVQPFLFTAEGEPGDPAYTLDQAKNALDRASALARSLVRGFNLVPRISGNNLGF